MRGNNRYGLFTRRLRAGGGGARVIVLTTFGLDEYVVAALRCPHRGVELEYQPDKNLFRCASLGHSKFALDGHKLGGPASHGIKVYTASVADGIVTIKLEA